MGSTVLPRSPWQLEPGRAGYKQMLARMVSIAEDPRIIKGKEDLNRILGLPRQTVIRPPHDEPICIPTPDGSGQVISYSAPLLTDADGDCAHEFWEEDKAGVLRIVKPRRGDF